MGATDLDGKNFCYTNPLINTQRTAVARLPLLREQHLAHPADDPDLDLRERGRGIYVNLFIGSRINVENVAGTNVEMVQKTDYPWKGRLRSR